MDKEPFAKFKAAYEGEIAELEDRVKKLLQGAEDHAALGEERHAGTIRNLKSQAGKTQRIVEDLKTMLERACKKQAAAEAELAAKQSEAAAAPEAAPEAADAAGGR